jgi:hypothetical protein
LDQRLQAFRERAKVARAATELTDEIDKPLLVTAGWRVHTDNQTFLGATKVTDAGDEIELRVGRLNKSIGGTFSAKRRPPPKQSLITGFAIAMGEAFQARQMEVRKHTVEELDWRELVRFT